MTIQQHGTHAPPALDLTPTPTDSPDVWRCYDSVTDRYYSLNSVTYEIRDWPPSMDPAMKNDYVLRFLENYASGPDTIKSKEESERQALSKRTMKAFRPREISQ